jgi:hypothetical protein
MTGLLKSLVVAPLTWAVPATEIVKSGAEKVATKALTDVPKGTTTWMVWAELSMAPVAPLIENDATVAEFPLVVDSLLEPLPLLQLIRVKPTKTATPIKTNFDLWKLLVDIFHLRFPFCWVSILIR